MTTNENVIEWDISSRGDTTTSNSAEIRLDYVEVLDSEYLELSSKLKRLSNLSFDYKGALALTVNLEEDGLVLMFPMSVESGWAYKVAHVNSEGDIAEYEAESAFMRGRTHGIFQKIIPQGLTSRPREKITEASADYLYLFKLLQRAVDSPEYEEYIDEALDMQSQRLIEKMRRRGTISRLFSKLRSS